MAKAIIGGTFAEAVADIPDGIQLLIPGFGPGSPHNLLTALYEHSKAKNIWAISNGIGFPSAAGDGRKSLGDLIAAERVSRVTAAFTAPTHPSQQSVSADMIRAGTLKAELVPQGTLAERVRAGGSGIPAFYTPAGVGTLTATGKETRDFNGRTYVMEEAIFADYAFIRAWKADTKGNLIFRLAARNFNPVFAMGAKHTIVEVDEIVEAGELPPDSIHTPGVVVERVIQIPPDGFLRDIPRT